MNKHILVLLFSTALALSSFAQETPKEEEVAPVQAEPATTQVLEAQDQQGTITQTITETKETTTATTKDGKAIVTQDLKGQIESIDPEGRTFSVGGKTFKLWKTGKVFFKRKKKDLSDLKVGDLVAVTYRVEKDGSLSASRINK